MPRKANPETKLYAEALDWCALNGYRAWRTNTGRRGGISFGFKGQPDICGYSQNGAAVFIECKREGERLTTEQYHFLHEATRNACIVYVWTEAHRYDLLQLPDNMKPKGSK
jgi:hypothetical protein